MKDFTDIGALTRIRTPAQFVSILPQKYFVEKIGADRVNVTVMVMPGANPATYEPRPKQMAKLAKARIYFSIGVPFEQYWLPRMQGANPKMNLVSTDAGIQKIPMAAHHHFKEDGAGKGDVHEDANRGEGRPVPDPHIWTSPLLVKTVAANIFDALVQTDPEHQPYYKTRYQAFLYEIEQLHSRLKKMLSGPLSNKRFMVFHPSWGYFAGTYGLEQIPVEVEGKAPKMGQVREIIDIAKKSGIRVVFVQPQFSSQSAGVIADAIGGTVVAADPLAENWEDNLLKQAAAFKAAMQQ